MKLNNRRLRFIFIMTAALVLIMACSLSGGQDLQPSPTPTPTKDVPPLLVSPTVESVCHGRSGSFEMQVLVGPADAAGLEPFAVGSIPFTVKNQGDSYLIQGSGPISYQEVLAEEWGTYTVSLEMDATVEGVCTGDEKEGALDVTINVSGEQMVEVRSEGFAADYPWSGTHELDMAFPLETGAQAEGEGWAFVLHLNE